MTSYFPRPPVRVFAGLLLLTPACGEPPPPSPDEPPLAIAADRGLADRPSFVDRAAETGLDFIQFNGMSGEYFMAEVTGSGGAFFDADNDGDLDVYLVQGAMLGAGKTLDDAIFAPAYPAPLTDRFYRNQLVETGELRFTDATAASGLSRPGLAGPGFRAAEYGMGVAAGDFDNDGWIDLYVTNFGPNRMLRNHGPDAAGNPTFTDVTEATGTGDGRWSVPAVFFDYDRDGWLDLYVGNYIAEDLVNRQICRDFIGAQDYCGPGSFAAEPDRLLRNLGGEGPGLPAFEDVTVAVGMRGGFGAALGVVAADFDGDGLPDLYVTNDSQPNNLWLQRSDSDSISFTDEALLAGTSVNARGKAEASMGVDAADFDGDGDLDLFLTHLTGETNTLYVNDGSGFFEDATIDFGLAAASRPFTSFGTAWFDADNDGWLDLLIVNGAVKKIEALARRNDPFPLHQPNQLFLNRDGRFFEEVSAAAGEVFSLSEVSRGAVFGDVDNDGDTDVLIVNSGGPVRLLINQTGNHRARHWLGLRLVDEVPRDQVGARVAVEREGRPTLWRRVHTDASFCSSNDPRVLVGLGDEAGVDRVRVIWPDGRQEAWTEVETDRYVVLRRGSGSPVEDLR
ncbi:MAG: CRTAC1 family protein [Thermoanaerobaculia bacterium]